MDYWEYKIRKQHKEELISLQSRIAQLEFDIDELKQEVLSQLTTDDRLEST